MAVCGEIVIMSNLFATRVQLSSIIIIQRQKKSEESTRLFSVTGMLLGLLFVLVKWKELMDFNFIIGL
jgi:hypothetical protein